MRAMWYDVLWCGINRIAFQFREDLSPGTDNNIFIRGKKPTMQWISVGIVDVAGWPIIQLNELTAVNRLTLHGAKYSPNTCSAHECGRKSSDEKERAIRRDAVDDNGDGDAFGQFRMVRSDANNVPVSVSVAVRISVAADIRNTRKQRANKSVPMRCNAMRALMCVCVPILQWWRRRGGERHRRQRIKYLANLPQAKPPVCLSARPSVTFRSASNQFARNGQNVCRWCRNEFGNSRTWNRA